MKEAELIKEIKKLRSIKPRRDWVLLTKKRLFGEEPVYGEQISVSFFPALKTIFRNWRIIYQPAFAGVLSVLAIAIVLSTFAVAQNALPGDLLYPVKKVSEKSRVVFVSQEEKPKVQLEIANKRLEELTKVVKTKQSGKLASAVGEVQMSVREAAKELKDPQKLTKEIVDETKKLEENREKIKALGVLIEDGAELDDALASLVEREIEELEQRNLPEGKTLVLKEAKTDLQSGKFSQALEKILLISN